MTTIYQYWRELLPLFERAARTKVPVDARVWLDRLDAGLPIATA